jgi:hypothetical protein
MIRKSTPGQHRVADGAVADTRVSPTDGGPAIPADISTGPFTVQRLNEQWFIGWPGAAQRIADPLELDSWLAANGGLGRASLDFGGNGDLEQQFWTEMEARPRNEQR